MFVSDLLKDAQKCLLLFFKQHNCVVDYCFAIMYNCTVLLFLNVYLKESLKVRVFEREREKTQRQKTKKKKMVKRCGWWWFNICCSRVV